jgi:hypothetical protein
LIKRVLFSPITSGVTGRVLKIITAGLSQMHEQRVSKSMNNGVSKKEVYVVK